MYSNIFFIIIILCFAFAPLISADGSQLSPDFYKYNCSVLQKTVWQGVWKASQDDPRMPASILRLHFHDCFVNGCDGSVLIDDPHGERRAPANKDSARGFDVIDNIKVDVERHCKETVSCADILALAARAAVKLSITHEGLNEKDNWQPWPFVGGRLDGFVSDWSEANRSIPSPADTLDTIITKFRNKGLNLTDLVALSGAHTIGKAHCTNFKARIFPYRDSSMNPALYPDLLKACRHKDKLAPLDIKTPQDFDNRYYVNLFNNSGVLKSDQALWTDLRTKSMVEKFGKHQDSFLTAFGHSMAKMGNIDVITAHVQPPRKGTIRKKCSTG